MTLYGGYRPNASDVLKGYGRVYDEMISRIGSKFYQTSAIDVSTNPRVSISNVEDGLYLVHVLVANVSGSSVSMTNWYIQSDYGILKDDWQTNNSGNPLDLVNGSAASFYYFGRLKGTVSFYESYGTLRVQLTLVRLF